MNTNHFGHYTSQIGLIGIISSESIWATNIKFLNDEHEFQDALDLIREIIPTAKITSEHPNHSVYVQYIERLNKELLTLDRHVTESVFTCSFSKETDLLSQWRGYCPDNNRFCLVFDINELFDCIKEVYSDAHLVECVYEKKEKRSKIVELLNEYWTKYFTSSDEKSKKNVMNELSWKVMLLASYFKHPSFSEEKEKRIVVIDQNGNGSELQFREGKYSIIPYLVLPSPRKNIKQIHIGPTSNKELSKRSLEMFLEKSYGIPSSFMKDFDIKYSNTPYRPW